MITRLNQALAAKQAKRAEGDKGFTLIELLVVVLIIGVLAAIAIPIFLGQQATARDSAVKSDIQNAKTAVVAQMVTGTALSAITIAGLTDFTPATTSNLTLTTTGSTAFCISGYDTANTITSIFHATDKSGVKAGACPA